MCERPRFRRARLAALAIGVVVVTASIAGAQDRVVVAWDESLAGPSFVQAIEADPPWGYATPALATGAQGVLQSAFGRVYHLSRHSGELLVIDARSFTVLASHDLGVASEPRDLAVVSPHRGYVARAKSSWLARIDLASGALSDVVDLGAFADGDGFPEMERMLAHEGRLYVQLRRIDFSPVPGRPEPPLLAVVDLATEQLVDVDPVTAGVQAIELSGTAPRFAMQVLPVARLLLLSATGAFHDAGGIEWIDLDTLQSVGLLIPEFGGEVGADLGAFRMHSESQGYLAFSTDLLLSSHLHAFDTAGDVDPTEHQVALDYFVPHLLLDRAGAQLYWPEPGGLHVFDTATGARLTTDLIPLGGLPSDLALAVGGPALPGLSRSGAASAVAALLAVAAWAARDRTRSLRGTRR